MLTTDQARDRATDLVARAIRAGADAADVIYVGDAATQVQVRLGALEDVERSEGEEIGLRVFYGRQSASASSSDLSLAALDEMAARAVAMAREAPEDRFAGLAPEDRLMRDALPDLETDDPTDVAPDALRARALEAEDVARAIPGVTNSEGGSASAGRAVVALATSHGFSGAYGGSSHGVYASVLAGEGAGMQRDYGHHATRFLSDLDSADAVGRDAGARAVSRLNPIRLKSGPMPVVFDRRIGGSMVSHLINAILGGAIARKVSFLQDALGTAVFDSGVTIVDDPHRRRGMRSRPFDGEGLPTAARKIIDHGVLTGWLMDSASARQLELEPTGHASRGVSGPPSASPSNLHMEPGPQSPATLMADIKLGFYATDLIGHGVNGLTGDYSLGAAGFAIRDGVIDQAVSEVTIAGNLKDMFRALTPANDLEFRRGTNVPTLRIDGMTLAGE